MLLNWLRNARWVALPQSFLPALVAFSFAYKAENADFSWGLGVLAIVGVLLLHLGMNLFDDFFDYKHKEPAFRKQMAAQGVKSRIGKCSYLQSEGGTASVKQLLWVAILFCLVAAVIGFIILIYRGLPIFYIAMAAVLLGLFYSAPPFRLSYHGLGELTVGFIFGPLAMVGVCYSTCGTIPEGFYILSLAAGLLVANVLFTHSVLDLPTDKFAGKKTLAVCAKNARLNLGISFLMNFLPICIILISILLRYLSGWYCIILILLPFPIYLFYTLCWFAKEPQKVFEYRFWMGHFPRWRVIKEAQLDWFMLRWFLSRNYMLFFCLILILLNFII
ncbi:MAG: prenyltransferase [Bacteroidales bacterium]|jgi:1,4-dihydroxy-2-naphthoate octaprenyltransferase|nr:prenyltransferase [Bacteroidales bacterium]